MPRFGTTGYLALATPEFQVIAELDASGGLAKMVLELLVSISTSTELSMETVVQTIKEELDRRSK